MRSFARSFVLTFIAAVFVLSFSAPVLAQDFATNTQPAPLANAPVADQPVIEAGEGVVEEAPQIPASDLLPPVDVVQLAEELASVLLNFVRALVSTVEGAVGAFMTIPFTVVIVSLLKRIPALKNVTSPTITFAVAVVLWVVAAITGRFGVQAQFYNLIDVLGTALPNIIGVIVTLVGSPAVFNWLARRNTPVIGYQRSKGVAGVPAQTVNSAIEIAFDEFANQVASLRRPTPGIVQSEGTTISGIWEPSDEDRNAA